MTLTRSFIRNAAMTPLDARLMNMATLVANSDGTPRVGVLSAPASIVSTLATMNVAVAAAEFATSKGKADGVSIFTNDGTVNVAIAAAPASNSRIDVIWVKHNDDTTGDANALPVFGVTAGTAAASPTKPAIPTGALELATLRVYAGTTATNGGSNTLTNTYQRTAMRGGVVEFRSKAELDLWTNPIVGQQATVNDTMGLYEWIGTQWLPILIPRTNFVPSWANFVMGTSVLNEAWYEVMGSRCYGEIHLTIGAGYSMNSNNVDFAPPVASTFPDNAPMGQAAYLDNGSGWYFGELFSASNRIQLLHRLGGSATIGRVAAGQPFGWANTDQMHLAFSYRIRP